MKRLPLLLSLAAASALLSSACTDSDDPMSEEGETSGDGDGDGDGGEPCAPADDPVDEGSCMALDTDYLPQDSDNDPYPACISDGGVYELFADPPGSIARIEAMDEIAALLWLNGTPSAEDFTAARTIYETPEGLGSRVDRREDLHYPPIPEEEWDPGLDPDKQCSNSELAAAYPARCAGPSTLRPLINQAFIDGMSGNGDPNLHAARIKAGFVWFSYLSVYKEAFTCIAKGKDCDSSWAYYTGGAQADGALLGFARMIDVHSNTTHQRIFDGILAVRCWRDLYPDVDSYPTYEDLPMDAKDMFDTAWEQLDDALARGFAISLRQHLLAQDDETCSGATMANWEFVRLVGGALDREVRERDAAAADELLAIYDLDAPTSEDLDEAVALLDGAIPCP